jgi:predicted glycoside hydrolase/deacetylase ChbG (UPF0249 family)
LDENGNWDNNKVNRKYAFLSNEAKSAFSREINAQIIKAKEHKIPIIHLDSHYHTHALPCFYQLFIEAAKSHKLKIRLAQTYRENSYLKFYYRRYINGIFKANHINYSDLFENVPRFLKNANSLNTKQIMELMIHPDFDSSGVLFDHYDIENHKDKEAKSIKDWISFLGN